MMAIRRAAFLAAVSLIVGCGGPDLVSVSGTVTLDDEPLPGAFVTFEPLRSDLGLASTGVTNEAGEYTLSCGDRPGAVSGTHRVLITTISPEDYKDEHSTMPRDRVPPHYQDGSLTFDVPEDGADGVDWELSTRKR